MTTGDIVETAPSKCVGDADTLAEARAAVEHPALPSQTLRPNVWMPHSINFQLSSDALDLIMAPGDVLCVRGSGRLSEIGNAGGFLGHMLVVISPPRSIRRSSKEGLDLEAAWPPDANVKELWRVTTMDCTRQAPGLHETESLLFVERVTGRLILAGEMTFETKLVLNEHEAVEIWQSPWKLRHSLRFDLMQEVVADMREHKGLAWSKRTAARAFFQSARAVMKPTHEQTLENITECWTKAPICTSVIIIFWQRYLVKLSGVVTSKKGPGHRVEPAELVMKWMPLKADCVLPGDLQSTLKDHGWVSLAQIPRIFQPTVCHNQGMMLPLLTTSLPPVKTKESNENVRIEETMLESRIITLTC